MLEWYNRELHDALALVLHIASLAIALGLDSSFARTTPGALIVTQEVVTIVFHMFYCYNYVYNNARAKPNLYKWSEYALSATLGTVAALQTGQNTTAWYWVVFVVVAGAGQQTVGYRIDSVRNTVDMLDWVSYSFAATLQIGEFIVVWASDPAWRIASVYTAGWSSFGVHAGLVLFFYNDTTSKWSNVDWVEAVYSCLSWIAKLSVFWAIFSEDTANDTTVFVLTCVLAPISAAAVLYRSEPTLNDTSGNLL